jgi:hypothetical protein
VPPTGVEGYPYELAASSARSVHVDPSGGLAEVREPAGESPRLRRPRQAGRPPWPRFGARAAALAVAGRDTARCGGSREKGQ